MDHAKLEWNWHHEELCNHLQAAIEDWARAGVDDSFTQRFQDLAVNVCPLSLKSKIFMVAAQAWIWLEHPTWSGLFTSGTPSNVDRDSLACRDLVMSRWYRETYRIKWTIRPDLDRVAKWGTTAGGVRESRGMMGSFTGIHVDGIFIDDPDDAAGVHSDAARRDTWLSWLALGNRLNDLKRPVRFIIQQNVHAEDLSTKLVAQGVPRLSMPLEFKVSRRCRVLVGKGDPRTVDGQILHPKRFTPAVVAAERKRLGPHGFAAQYNCDPAPLDGGMIKRSWLGFFRIDGEAVTTRPRPDGCEDAPTLVLGRRVDDTLQLEWLTITVDATFGSLKDTASRVGLLVMGGEAMRRFVFDDRTRRMTFLDTVTAIKTAIAATMLTWSRRRVPKVLVELKANGAAVIEQLKKEMGDGNVKTADGRPILVEVEAITPEGGKIARANAMVPAIAAGSLYVLEGAPWLTKGEDEDDDGFVFEVTVFPNGTHDDRVDALSQLMAHYGEKSGVERARQLAGFGQALQKHVRG